MECQKRISLHPLINVIDLSSGPLQGTTCLTIHKRENTQALIIKEMKHDEFTQIADSFIQ